MEFRGHVIGWWGQIPGRGCSVFLPADPAGAVFIVVAAPVEFRVVLDDFVWAESSVAYHSACGSEQMCFSCWHLVSGGFCRLDAAV